jgi:hypothetical protein
MRNAWPRLFLFPRPNVIRLDIGMPCARERGTIAFSMTQQLPHPDDLSDAELAEQAHAWRRLALRGDRSARAPAHAYETALRERVRASMAAELIANASAAAPESKRPWWRRWWPLSTGDRVTS